MSTIFGAIFFVILILMGFNLMTWNFLQYDAYNGVVTSMKQRDQQAASENLAATAPGATGFSGNRRGICYRDKGLHLQSLTVRLYSMLSRRVYCRSSVAGELCW